MVNKNKFCIHSIIYNNQVIPIIDILNYENLTEFTSEIVKYLQNLSDNYLEAKKVNDILDVQNDPWGVCSWWWTVHGRIQTCPINLLETNQASQLINLAQSIFDDSY